MNYSGRNDHLFTVYYVVNGKVCGIAESTNFRLVTPSMCPSYHPLEFNRVSVNERLLGKLTRGRAPAINSKKPKLSDSIAIVNETTSTDKSYEPSPFDADCFLSRTLYSFDDKDDVFTMCCHYMEWIYDNEGV